MAKPEIGDIVEIPLSGGFAYGLYTHANRQFGALIRVFRGISPKRSHDLSRLVELPIQFSTFFPLSAAVKRHLVTLVGNISAPENLAKFPLFRDGVANPRTGKVDTWWLWDGEKEWQVHDLPSGFFDFPIREVINDTLLRKRIEEDWHPCRE